MSVGAMSWVLQHSPYKGTGYTLHLCVADSVNDEHGDEFWMAPAKLAVKARTTRETTSRWLWQAVEDGYLEVLEDHRRRFNTTSRFRFLMPGDAEPKYDPRTPTGEPSVTTDHAQRDDRSHACVTTDHLSPSSDPKVNPSDSRADEAFAEFWAHYPSRDGRKLGKGKCQERWRKLKPTDHEAAVAGAREYARERGGVGQVSPKDPERWLRDRCWEDFQPKGQAPPECSDEHAGRRDAVLRQAAFHLNLLLRDGDIEGDEPYPTRDHYADKAERDRIREAFERAEGMLPSAYFTFSGVGQ